MDLKVKLWRVYYWLFTDKLEGTKWKDLFKED